MFHFEGTFQSTPDLENMARLLADCRSKDMVMVPLSVYELDTSSFEPFGFIPSAWPKAWPVGIAYTSIGLAGTLLCMLEKKVFRLHLELFQGLND